MLYCAALQAMAMSEQAMLSESLTILHEDQMRALDAPEQHAVPADSKSGVPAVVLGLFSVG